VRSVGQGEDVARGASPTVFVSDPSAEAERIAQALRATGYVVVDVPMSMLLARVAVQRPRIVLVDADAEGALESVGRLRELPDAEGIDVIFFGHAGQALKGPEDALAHEGSGFFDRPVDVPGLVRKVEALTGGPLHDDLPARASTPPPSLPSSRMPAAVAPEEEQAKAAPDAGKEQPAPKEARRASSRPPPRPPSGPPKMTVTPPTTPEAILSSTARHSSRRTVSIQTPLSSELEALLADAEQRIGEQMAMDAVLPTPEEEIEAVLPADVLSSLDEPLDADEDDAVGKAADEAESMERVETGAYRAATHAGEVGAVETHGGAQPAPTTSNRGPATSNAETPPRAGVTAERPSVMNTDRGSGAVSRREGSAPPPPTEYQPAASPAVLAAHVASSTLGSVALQADAVAIAAAVAQRVGAAEDRGASTNTSLKAKSVPPPIAPLAASPAPSVLGETDAPLVLARAIAARATGALCFESSEGVRRAVLREGDLLTAASGVDSESLLAFLGARGDLPRERVQQLVGKLPPFGRHAGAALVAHGDLRQDQLWPVLRAHAEWILGKAILVRVGTAHLEAEAPGRLRGEPSVFGGSTGAEVMVEVVRRVVTPEDALARLGGPNGRVGEGNQADLLSECALDAAERELILRTRGSTLGEVVQAAHQPDFASVLYAISLLGVIDVIRGVGGARGEDVADEAEIEALDEEAIRARVRARLELVDEGDYFSVLGVGHDATGYEVRRAFLDLRRAFEPSRLLTPRIADLADDVRKIASVLEEAYEILSDNARRERYRRAIFASPEA
jgi:hypothetical protein